MRLVILSGLLITLCGCATKPFMINDSSRFAAPGSAFDGQATLYVMRDSSGVGIKWPTHIDLDGVEKGTILREGYMRLAVSPGRHVITGHWNFLSTLPAIAVSSDFKAGNTYYFDVGNDTGDAGAGIVYEVSLNPVNPAVGAEMVDKYEDETPGTGN